MYNPFSLENKTILVTGASSEIGSAIATECSKMGARIILSGGNLSNLEKTCSFLEGVNHEIIQANLANKKDLSKLVSSLPVIDGIVHCAGFVPFQFALKDTIDKVLSVNFFDPAEMTKSVLRKKKLAKGSSVVFISLASGVHCPAVVSSIYAASKSAINGLIKGMALDLASQNIRINSINPGFIGTNLSGPEQATNEQFEEDKKRYPLKRFGKPEEVAYAVIYLLSDASSWITGANLFIDADYTLL